MKLENLVLGVAVLAVLSLIGACERMKWNECRRVHPGWYCFATAGGGQ